MNEYVLTECLMNIGEATTMSSISYLPSTVGAVTTAVHSLVKSKQDWDVQIEDDDKHRNVTFEDALKVQVPLQHWEGFSKAYGVTKAGKISLKHLLKEALEEGLDQLRTECKLLLSHYYSSDTFTVVDKQANVWRSAFGITEEYDIKTAVSVSNREKDIQFMYTKLMKMYGNDRGGLELLIAALQDYRPMGSFEIFNKFDFLYGIKVLSMYRKVNIIYESLVDMSYQFNQSVSVDPKHSEVIYALGELKDSSVKVVKNVIFPVGSVFTKRFYKQFKNLIKDVAE